MILAISTGSTILYSIIVFLLVILMLVSILLFARDKLAPKGDVNLNINDREIAVSPGIQPSCQHFQEMVYFFLLHAAAEEHAECANARLLKEEDQFFLLKQDFLQERNSIITGVLDAR